MKTGKPVIGTWNTVGSPLVTEILAHAGLDFIVVDFEHGPFQLDQAHIYVDKCEQHSCSPIFRIPANSDWMALQVLDQGAHGVIVPHVRDEETAKEFASHTKYFPKGTRGFTPFTKAGGFVNADGLGYAAKANDFVLAAVIVESIDAIKQLDRILGTEAIDIVYFGAYDLSQDLGIPGDTNNPKLVELIGNAVKDVLQAGKYAGGFVPQSKDQIDRCLDMGMNFITWEVDSSIIFRAAKDVSEHIKSIKK